MWQQEGVSSGLRHGDVTGVGPPLLSQCEPGRFLNNAPGSLTHKAGLNYAVGAERNEFKNNSPQPPVLGPFRPTIFVCLSDTMCLAASFPAGA